MYKYAIKISAIVIALVLLVLTGYYFYLTKNIQEDANQDNPQTIAVDTTQTEQTQVTDFGLEVAEKVDQVYGKYDMFDGNRIYIKPTNAEKLWVFVKPTFQLYCTDSLTEGANTFGGQPEEKSAYIIEEIMEMGDNVYVSFMDDNGEKYLDKLLTDSPSACK